MVCTGFNVVGSEDVSLLERCACPHSEGGMVEFIPLVTIYECYPNVQS